MTRIDFYILPDASSEQRLTFTCRLIDKAQKLNNQVYVACDNAEQAQALSRLLWSFQPQSFIAHDLQGQPQRHAKVLLGWDDNCGDHHQVLVNLKKTIPTYFSRFERLTEVVSQEEQILEQTREHYSFYRERGYPINNNDMRR